MFTTERNTNIEIKKPPVEKQNTEALSTDKMEVECIGLSAVERIEQLRSYRQDLYFDLDSYKEHHSEHIWKLIKNVEQVINSLLLYPYASIVQTKAISELFKSGNEAKQPVTNSHKPILTFTKSANWDEVVEEIRKLNNQK